MTLRAPVGFDWDNFDTNVLKPFLKNNLFEGIIGKRELAMLSDECLIEKKGTVLIGIHDPDSGFNPTDVTHGFDDVLEVKFWDTEGGEGEAHPPISSIQGLEIREFIEKHKDKRFLIHCHAGMSRSAGVGCAVECIVNYHGDVYSFKTGLSDVKDFERYYPNWKVFDTILGR